MYKCNIRKAKSMNCIRAVLCCCQEELDTSTEAEIIENKPDPLEEFAYQNEETPFEVYYDDETGQRTKKRISFSKFSVISEESVNASHDEVSRHQPERNGIAESLPSVKEQVEKINLRHKNIDSQATEISSKKEIYGLHAERSNITKSSPSVKDHVEKINQRNRSTDFQTSDISPNKDIHPKLESPIEQKVENIIARNGENGKRREQENTTEAKLDENNDEATGFEDMKKFSSEKRLSRSLDDIFMSSYSQKFDEDEQKLDKNDTAHSIIVTGTKEVKDLHSQKSLEDILEEEENIPHLMATLSQSCNANFGESENRDDVREDTAARKKIFKKVKLQSDVCHDGLTSYIFVDDPEDSDEGSYISADGENVNQGLISEKQEKPSTSPLPFDCASPLSSEFEDCLDEGVGNKPIRAFEIVTAADVEPQNTIVKMEEEDDTEKDVEVTKKPMPVKRKKKDALDKSDTTDNDKDKTLDQECKFDVVIRIFDEGKETKKEDSSTHSSPKSHQSDVPGTSMDNISVVPVEEVSSDKEKEFATVVKVEGNTTAEDESSCTIIEDSDEDTAAKALPIFVITDVNLREKTWIPKKDPVSEPTPRKSFKASDDNNFVIVEVPKRKKKIRESKNDE